MRTINSISSELNKKLCYITNYDRTRILVMVDRILTKPYVNHRMELSFYSIRYKSIDKTIYIYSKACDFNENFDFDGDEHMDFPNEFSVKIMVDNNIKQLINNIKGMIYKYMKRLSKCFL